MLAARGGSGCPLFLSTGMGGQPSSLPARGTLIPSEPPRRSRPLPGAGRLGCPGSVSPALVQQQCRFGLPGRPAWQAVGATGPVWPLHPLLTLPCDRGFPSPGDSGVHIHAAREPHHVQTEDSCLHTALSAVLSSFQWHFLVVPGPFALLHCSSD